MSRRWVLEGGRIINQTTILLKGVAGMEQMLEAVFENGTFRLLEPSAVTLVDGQHIGLTGETEGTLAPAFTVPLGLTSDNST
jgi:hypothetical protein